MDFFRAGRAVLLRGNPATVQPHLWFILTDPDPTTLDVAAVMLVTARPHTDKTLMLCVGDHEFITHDSAVDYGSARRLKVVRLEALVTAGRCEMKADMASDLLKRVRDGLLKSPRTIHHIADWCRPRFG